MNNNIITNLPYVKSSRQRSWITLEQIDKEYPEIIIKLSEILFTDKYGDSFKKFARDVIDFLVDWEYLSWKQFDSVVRICKNYTDYINKIKSGTFVNKICNKYYYIRGGAFVVLDKYINIKTDKQIDILQEKIFGHRTLFPEELDGMELSYNRNGQRIFLLPT